MVIFQPWCWPHHEKRQQSAASTRDSSKGYALKRRCELAVPVDNNNHMLLELRRWPWLVQIKPQTKYWVYTVGLPVDVGEESHSSHDSLFFFFFEQKVFFKNKSEMMQVCYKK